MSVIIEGHDCMWGNQRVNYAATMADGRCEIHYIDEGGQPIVEKVDPSELSEIKPEPRSKIKQHSIVVDAAAPMPDKLTDRELLIAQVVVLFARAAMIQNDLNFLREQVIPNDRSSKEAFDEKHISYVFALMNLWGPLMKLIDSTPDWAERMK